MRFRHAALPALLGVATLAAPAGAQAATLVKKPAKPCYGTADKVSLLGEGFTPRAQVDIGRDGRRIGRVTSNSVGAIAALATVPTIRRDVQRSTYTATDQTDPSLTASVPVRLSRLRVTVRPGDSRASQPRRIKARGFTTGKRLYVHIVRGKSRRLVRVGRLKGACRTISAVRRIFGADAKLGTYRVQFDAFRRYSAKRDQRVRFQVTIRRTVDGAAAAAGVSGAATQSWRLLD